MNEEQIIAYIQEIYEVKIRNAVVEAEDPVLVSVYYHNVHDNFHYFVLFDTEEIKIVEEVLFSHKNFRKIQALKN